jgi:hypothetical protein
MPVPLQLLLGALAAAAVCMLFMVLAIAGVPVGTAGWIGVFLSFWVMIYVSIKKRMIAMLVAFIIVEFSLYFFLAARGFRLWW